MNTWLETPLGHLYLENDMTDQVNHEAQTSVQRAIAAGGLIPKVEYSWLEKIQIFVILAMAKVRFWKQKNRLAEAQMASLKKDLASNYYIICTRRENYLTTFLIGLGHYLLTGRWGFYSHVLMNLEDEVTTDDDFRFIEATGDGVHYSTFEEVFGPVDAVALVVPKSMTVEEWTLALDTAKLHVGTPYDNLFNMKNDLEINCAELIQIALKATPNYSKNFANFDKLVSKKKKITPDMFAECEDFHIVYKVKR